MRASPIERTYQIDDLMRESGATRTQIRDYIHAGLLPRAHGRGPTAFYTDVHLNRLLEIRRVKDQRVTIYTDLRERWAD